MNGYNCAGCGRWVSTETTNFHLCPAKQTSSTHAWPSTTPPSPHFAVTPSEPRKIEDRLQDIEDAVDAIHEMVGRLVERYLDD